MLRDEGHGLIIYFGLFLGKKMFGGNLTNGVWFFKVANALTNFPLEILSLLLCVCVTTYS